MEMAGELFVFIHVGGIQLIGCNGWHLNLANSRGSCQTFPYQGRREEGATVKWACVLLCERNNDKHNPREVTITVRVMVRDIIRHI